jgi:hypothetical protein
VRWKEEYLGYPKNVCLAFLDNFLALLGCFGVGRSIKTIEISTPIGVLSEDGFDKIDENDVFLP